jgi:hypothetical protein
MSEEAPITGREPIEPPPIKATFHINTTTGVQIPDSLIPKGEDGKPLPAPPDPILERRLDSYRRDGVAEEVVQQFREGKSIPQEEHNLAWHRLKALEKDPVFYRRYLDGGVEERRIMRTLTGLMGLPIKEEESNG